jgi:hypothetical protein
MTEKKPARTITVTLRKPEPAREDAPSTLPYKPEPSGPAEPTELVTASPSQIDKRSASRSQPRKGEYEVGYKKPPKQSQFKPNQSGNPKGRPKGARSLRTVLRDELSVKVLVGEGGRSRKLSKAQIAMRRLANKAAEGDVKSIQTILKVEEEYERGRLPPTDPGGPPEVRPSEVGDHDILTWFGEAYAASKQGGAVPRLSPHKKPGTFRILAQVLLSNGMRSLIRSIGRAPACYDTTGLGSFKAENGGNVGA